MNSDVKVVTFFPRLANEIMLQGDERFFYYWHIARLADTDGNGWIYAFEFIDAICEIAGKSHRTARDILNEGKDEWWTIGGTPAKVFYKGIRKIAYRYGLNKSYEIEMPVEYLASLVQFRAFTHASISAKDTNQVVDRRMRPAGAKTVSREVIANKINGKSKPTQRKYERMMGVKVTRNFVEVELSDIENQPIFDEEGHLLPSIRNFDANQDGKNELVRQLPSSYSFAADPRGVRRFGSHDGISQRADAHSRTRKYYDRKDRAVEAACKGDKGVYYVKYRYFKHGYNLWERLS